MTSDQWIAFLVIVVAAFLGVCAIAAINRIDHCVRCGMTADEWLSKSDARIRRAEAAEKAVKALVVWMHDSTTANWEPVMEALQEHADQGRVVRKLEESK